MYMITFAPLMATMHKKRISKTELMEKLGVSSATIAKISKDEYVSMKVIDEICTLLECNIDDVISHIKDKENG